MYYQFGGRTSLVLTQGHLVFQLTMLMVNKNNTFEYFFFYKSVGKYLVDTVI